MMNQFFKNCAFGVVSAIGLVGVSAVAEARINIEPIIMVGYEYHSNFWYAEDDDVAVDTFFVKPGVIFEYETGKTKIDADFLVEGYWYRDHESDLPAGVDDAEDDNYVGFAGHFVLAREITNRITLGLDESGYYTRNPAQSDALDDSIDREKYFINRIAPSIYYDFGRRFDLSAIYTNTYTDYVDDGEGSMEHKGTVNFFYNFNDDVSIFLSHDIWTRDYDMDSFTYLSNRTKLNYSHRFHYFTFDAGAGYHNRAFDDSGIDDLDLFSWNVSLLGQNPPAPDKEPRAFMALILSQDMNDAGAGNTYYTATRVEAEFGYVFWDRLDTTVNGYFQDTDYETYDREDETYSVSGTIGYKFLRYFRLSLEGGYRERDSSVPGLSYEDTFGTVMLDFGLDIGML